MPTNVLVDAPKGLTSTSNYSITPLAGAATYTGTGELNYFPDVMVSCYADVDGKLYFDVSVNGTNWHETPVGGFVCSAGVLITPVEKIGPMYFRARYINGAGAQATFRLQAYFGTFRA